MIQERRQRGGLRGQQPPPTPKEREGREERKKEENERRNQKRQEVEPVIPRTCGQRLWHFMVRLGSSWEFADLDFLF